MGVEPKPSFGELVDFLVTEAFKGQKEPHPITKIFQHIACFFLVALHHEEVSKDYLQRLHKKVEPTNADASLTAIARDALPQPPEQPAGAETLRQTEEPIADISEILGEETKPKTLIDRYQEYKKQEAERLRASLKGFQETLKSLDQPVDKMAKPIEQQPSQEEPKEEIPRDVLGRALGSIERKKPQEIPKPTSLKITSWIEGAEELVGQAKDALIQAKDALITVLKSEKPPTAPQPQPTREPDLKSEKPPTTPQPQPTREPDLKSEKPPTTPQPQPTREPEIAATKPKLEMESIRVKRGKSRLSPTLTITEKDRQQLSHINLLIESIKRGLFENYDVYVAITELSPHIKQALLHKPDLIPRAGNVRLLEFIKDHKEALTFQGFSELYDELHKAAAGDFPRIIQRWFRALSPEIQQAFVKRLDATNPDALFKEEHLLNQDQRKEIIHLLQIYRDQLT